MDEWVKYLLKQAGYVFLIFGPVTILLIGIRLFVSTKDRSFVLILATFFYVIIVILIHDRATHRPISYREQAEIDTSS